MLGDKNFQKLNRLPSRYTLGLIFDYAPGETVWTVRASQETLVDVRPFEFEASGGALDMEGALASGTAHPFLGAPLRLDSPYAVPELHQRARATAPGGIRVDHEATLFAVTAPVAEPITGSPLLCSEIEFSSKKGTLLLDGNSHSLGSPSEVRISSGSRQESLSPRPPKVAAPATLGMLPTATALTITVKGTTSSLLVGGAEIVPSLATRFESQQPILARTASTVLGTAIIVLFATRGRALWDWVRGQKPNGK